MDECWEFTRINVTGSLVCNFLTKYQILNCRRVLGFYSGEGDSGSSKTARTPYSTVVWEISGAKNAASAASALVVTQC